MPTKHTPNTVVAGTRARPDHKRQRCLNVCLLVFGGLIVEALVQLIPWQAAIGARGLSGRLVAGVSHHCGGIQRLSSGVCGAARLVPFAAQVCPSRAFVLVSSLFSYKETITRVSFMCVQSVKKVGSSRVPASAGDQATGGPYAGLLTLHSTAEATSGKSRRREPF